MAINAHDGVFLKGLRLKYYNCMNFHTNFGSPEIGRLYSVFCTSWKSEVPFPVVLKIATFELQNLVCVIQVITWIMWRVLKNSNAVILKNGNKIPILCISPIGYGLESILNQCNDLWLYGKVTAILTSIQCGYWMKSLSFLFVIEFIKFREA